MNLILEKIAISAERLRLPHITENASLLAEEAAEKSLSYTEFLAQLLAAEVAAADERATDVLMRMAGFPFKKTLDDFEFKFQPQVKKRQLKELATCAFIGRAENLILLGPPGVGKTHLAVAIGLAAVGRRLNAKFTTCSDMVDSLTRAAEVGNLQNRLKVYVKPSLLIIDEIGFLPLDAAQANLLFQVVCRRYENNSIILTSNKRLRRMGRGLLWRRRHRLGDSRPAAASLDHHLDQGPELPAER